MDRRILICLIVVGLSLPLSVNAASPQPREFHPHASVDVLIPKYKTYTVSLTGLVKGDDISIDIQETSGNTISYIYIMNYENYTFYTEHGYLTTWPSKIYSNEWYLTTTFSVPTSGNWYVIFNNRHSTSIHIEGSVVSKSQQARGALFTIIIIIIVSIPVIIFVWYACLKRQKDKDKKKQPEPHPYAEQSAQPPQYRPIPQQEESVRFCPYCGTQRQSYDAQFCSRCGKAFND